jgi:replicative DNA helicase
MIDDLPMPSTPDAERAVVASLLVNTDAYDRVSTIIEPADFFVPAHRHVFEAVAAMEGRGADLVTVIDRLRRGGTLEAAGGVVRVAGLTDPSPDVANVEKYALIVKESSIRRRAIVECNRLSKSAFDFGQPIGEIAAQGAQMFSDFAAAGRRGPISARQLGRLTMDRLEAAMVRQEWLTGLPTGVHDLNSYTLGFQRGVLSLGGARPRVGKTAWTLAIVDAAMKAKHRLMYVELDMSEIMFGNRFLAYLSGVSSFKIRSGQGLSDEEVRKVQAAAREMHGLNDQLLLDYSTREITRLMSTIRREARKGVDLIIIDHIGHIRGGQGRERYLQLGDVSARLIEIAGETNAAVLALVQLGRDAENRAPQLSDLRESGNLEQDARLVVLLDRPHLRSSDVAACRLEMHVPKNEGEAGHTIVAHFDLSRQRVTDEGPCGDCSHISAQAPTREYRQEAFQ